MLKEPFIGEILTIIEATAMFKKDSRNADRNNGENDHESEKRERKKEENGTFGYSVVDDNDSRYDDDGEDVNLDEIGERGIGLK